MPQEEELVLSLLKTLFEGMSSPFKIAFGALFEYVNGEVIFKQNLTHQEKTQARIREEESKRMTGEKSMLELRQEGKQPFSIEIPTELHGKSKELLETLGIRYSFTNMNNGNTKIEVDKVNSELFMLGYNKIVENFEPVFEFSKKIMMESKTYEDLLKNKELIFKTNKEGVLGHIFTSAIERKTDKIFILNDKGSNLGNSYIELTGQTDFLKMVIDGKQVHLNQNVYYQELVSRVSKSNLGDVTLTDIGIENLVKEKYNKVKELIDKEPILIKINLLNDVVPISFNLNTFKSNLLHSGILTDFENIVGKDYSLTALNLFQAYELSKNKILEYENILANNKYSFGVRNNIKNSIKSLNKAVENYEKLPEFNEQIKEISNLIHENKEMFITEQKTSNYNEIIKNLSKKMEEAKVEFSEISSDKVKIMSDKELLESIIDSETFKNDLEYTYAFGDAELINRLNQFCNQNLVNEINKTNDIIANAKTSEDLNKIPKYSLDKALSQIENESYQDKGTVALVSETNNKNMIVFSDLDKSVNKITFIKNGVIQEHLTELIPDSYNLQDLLNDLDKSDKFINEFKDLEIGFSKNAEGEIRINDGKDGKGCYIASGEVLINDLSEKTLNKEGIFDKIARIQKEQKPEVVNEEKIALLTTRFYDYISKNKDEFEADIDIYLASSSLANLAANNGKFQTAFEDFTKSEYKQKMLSVALTANVVFQPEVKKAITPRVESKGK